MNQQEEFDASQEKTLEALDFYKQLVIKKYGDKVVCVPNVQYADSDYLIYINDYLNHFLEVKCRRTAFGEYATTKVPLRKHATAEHYFVADKIKSFFLAVFGDGVLAVLDLTQEPDRVETQVARYDRGNDKDIYAFYSIDKFVKLNI